MFTDGTSLFIEVDNRERERERERETMLIENDLVAVMNWAKSWLVIFSPSKTETMIISTKSRAEEHPPPHNSLQFNLFISTFIIHNFNESKHI